MGYSASTTTGTSNKGSVTDLQHHRGALRPNLQAADPDNQPINQLDDNPTSESLVDSLFIIRPIYTIITVRSYQSKRMPSVSSPQKLQYIVS